MSIFDGFKIVQCLINISIKLPRAIENLRGDGFKIEITTGNPVWEAGNGR
jgi:hypothetical protein